MSGYYREIWFMKFWCLNSPFKLDWEKKSKLQNKGHLNNCIFSLFFTAVVEKVNRIQNFYFEKAFLYKWNTFFQHGVNALKQDVRTVHFHLEGHWSGLIHWIQVNMFENVQYIHAKPHCFYGSSFTIQWSQQCRLNSTLLWIGNQKYELPCITEIGEVH